MKKILLSLSSVFILFLTACEGPTGPAGYDGVDGLDGIQAQVFEVEGVDFSYIAQDNLYETILPFSDFTSFEVLVNDAILVYQYDRSVEFDDGSVEDVWNLIPQTFFYEEGSLQFVPGHTTKDVEILITGNYDLSNLSTDITQNQIFRIVILPGEAAVAKLDKTNIADVMASIGVTEEDVLKTTLQ